MREKKYYIQMKLSSSSLNTEFQHFILVTDWWRVSSFIQYTLEMSDRLGPIFNAENNKKKKKKSVR